MLHLDDTDMLFPPRVISKLRNLRGPLWCHLVDRVARHHDERHLDVLAFTLLMIRRCSCMTCTAHSYRAMRGCSTCATQVVSRMRDTDEALLLEFEEIRNELEAKLPQVAGV